MRTEYTQEEVEQIVEALTVLGKDLLHYHSQGKVAVDKMVAIGYSDQAKIKEMYDQLDDMESHQARINDLLELIKKDS